MNIIIPGGMNAFRGMIRKKRMVIPRRGGMAATVGPAPSEAPEEGGAGDSLALFNEGGVTLLQVGML